MHQKAGTILRLFREQGGFVSGGRLSRDLDISRTAVWKHISALRDAGYVIEAVPSRGYRLVASPDLLDAGEIAADLATVIIGRRIVTLRQTDSTNTEAFRLAEEGAAEGTVVIADEQSSGKGRLGRTWISPPGANLYCSVILRPPVRPYEAPQLTFLSAVAVARAIERISSMAPEIKWPNDLLINGRKVAGLLNEMSAETDAVGFVILGIGVNLNMEAAQFPADLRQPATSLMLESGGRIPRSHYARLLFQELDLLYRDFLGQGFGPVREQWQQRCRAMGRPVTVSDGGAPRLVGICSGIDPHGALLVSRADGMVERVHSGDVRVL
jgi:BirA family biotin operon repressor/biotin-[acetyl-CoA-carboxylase] ligase